MAEEEFTACHFYDMPSIAVGTARATYQVVKEMRVEWLCMMRLSELETKDNKRVGSQDTRKTEQLLHILGQGFNAPMPVALPPFLASESGATGNQQENEGPENQLDIEILGDQSFNFEQGDKVDWYWEDANLVTIQEDITKTPSNQPLGMIDTAMDGNLMDGDLMDDNFDGRDQLGGQEN